MSEAIAEPLVELGVEPDGHVVLEADASGVATVLLNRPERRNAFDALTIRALTEAFETLHAADHVRVVFLRGAGGGLPCPSGGCMLRHAKVGRPRLPVMSHRAHASPCARRRQPPN